MARDTQTERGISNSMGNRSLIDGGDLDDARLNAAAVWHEKLRRDGSAESTWIDFAKWLEADGANRIAFDQIEDLYFSLEEAEPHLSTAVDAAQGSNVIRPGLWSMVRRFPIRSGAIGMALAASLVIAIGLQFGGDAAVHTDRYATATGETRTITLSDGSIVELNTATAITVTFGSAQRKVALEQGEAVFRVGKDPARPFLVRVGDRDIRDIGTVFDILNVSDRIVVTVADGKVGVSPHAASGSAVNATPVSLVAGEQLMIRAGHADSVRKVDPAIAMAWRDGYLTYKEAPLSLVVSDLNRYFPKRIVVSDDDTGLRRFSGALKVDDEDSVVSRLTELLPLTADRSGDGVITLRLKLQKD